MGGIALAVFLVGLGGVEVWRAYWYEEREWWVCLDRDGIQVIHEPSGDAYAYGTGWTLSQVEERHGLKRGGRTAAGDGSGDCQR